MLPPGMISRNFARWEFRCRCCGRLMLDGRLVDALQDLRDLSDRPIQVRSAYRCARHNEEVGGTRDSKHREGAAADVVIVGLSPAAMVQQALMIEAFRDGGIGYYPGQGFVHVDIGDKRRWMRDPNTGKMTGWPSFLQDMEREG